MIQRIIFIAILLSCINVQAQLTDRGTLIVGGSVGVVKPSTNSNYINNHPLTAGLRFGYFIHKNLALNVDFQSASYKEAFSRVGALQPPGGGFTEAGYTYDKFTSLGLSSEFYHHIGKKLFVIPAIFLYYFHNKFTEEGEYYSNGTPVGIGILRSIYYGYYARTGISMSVAYEVKPAFIITLRLVEYESQLHRNTDNLVLSAPLMIGIQYHFKP